MIIRTDPDTWYPDQRDAGHCSAGKLTAGQIVISERAPYRVVETRPVDTASWPAMYLETWTGQNCPDPGTWPLRPVVLVLRDERDDTAKVVHLQCPASLGWRTLPEHYAVCRRCGELPPCPEVHNAKVAERAGERFEQQMAILPGSCHGCLEPITSRQKVHRFDGPNLIRPDLGDDSAVFHLRGSCRFELQAYDRRWAAAEPGRRRSFYCEGHLICHHDDTATCSNPQCPSTEVEHYQVEWHQPGVRATWAGCWCLSGNLTAQP
ncbi:hypothetical protein [Kitasatospora sp. NPDC004272]